MTSTLYQRLGGYDAIASVVDDLLPRLQADAALGRFWRHRGSDGMAREKQLLIDYLANAAGGPLLYAGRALRLSHTGMGITDDDWSRFSIHLADTLDDAGLPDLERQDVLAFMASVREDLVDV